MKIAGSKETGNVKGENYKCAGASMSKAEHLIFAHKNGAFWVEKVFIEENFKCCNLNLEIKNTQRTFQPSFSSLLKLPFDRTKKSGLNQFHRKTISKKLTTAEKITHSR